MQLSARALIKPFDTQSAPADLEGDEPSDVDEPLSTEGGDDEDGDMQSDVDFSSDSGSDQDELNHLDRELEDDDDGFEGLDADAQQLLLEGTAAVRTTLDKVCAYYDFIAFGIRFISHLSQVRKLSFAIIHSTTIRLPAWRKACAANGLCIRLIPCDVRTRWNSVYDMLEMAVRYRSAIDDITANKSLKL